jgi:hypothetical protein
MNDVRSYLMNKLTLSIVNFPREIISIETFTENDLNAPTPKEAPGLPRYAIMAKNYMFSHREEILRHVDVLALYIDSFRKLFIKNLGSVNQDLIKYITTKESAVTTKKSYINLYLLAIKNAFKNAANNMLAVEEGNMLLMEIDLGEFERHYNKEFSEVNKAFLTTIKDMSSIAKAFGEPYVYSGWENTDGDKKMLEEYEASSNMKNRYLVDIRFDDDNIGRAELSIINYFKLGE